MCEHLPQTLFCFSNIVSAGNVWTLSTNSLLFLQYYFRGKCVNTWHKLSSVSPILFPRVMCEHSVQTLFCYSNIVFAGNVWTLSTNSLLFLQYFFHGKCVNTRHKLSSVSPILVNIILSKYVSRCSHKLTKYSIQIC